jgi:hypothetical protein
MTSQTNNTKQIFKISAVTANDKECRAPAQTVSRRLARVIAHAVSRRLPTAAAQDRAHVNHVEFVVDKVVLGQVFSEYFGFPCQFSLHRLLHNHHHLSSGADTMGQTVAAVPSGLSLTPPQEPRKLN